MLTKEVIKTMNNEIFIPLGFVSEDKKVRIVSIKGGSHLRNRINEMGLREGVDITVIKNSIGPVIIAIGQTRFALGRGISLKILTESIN
ncbi:MAG: FeoA domain-containing protein [Candidatus Heimdallarchaeota archaeon]|nr:ferrous iron transport protein A [Candidatus Heimdallarchaeota archaeon]MCG3255803.1 FeoA domain-containing protein [Candidatus Heimdallarchaeota archaeon]MCK4610876.1 FeoA domain-containing protein [Candidatus Heimdallarchaeota archaeon]